MINPTLSPIVATCSPVKVLARRLGFVGLLFVTVCCGRAAEAEKLSDGASQQIRALQAEKRSRSIIHRKLDSQFVFQLKQNRGQAIAQGVTRLQPNLKLRADGRVLVDIDANVTAGLLAQIEQSGGSVINSFPQYRAIRALVTLNQLESLAGSVDVKFIRRAREAHTHSGSVTSEGDVTHRANTARNMFGVTGKNVKVGVLSDSIDNLGYAQSTGDLPEVTVLPGQGGSGSGEGTAMLEIVHDVAPGAELYFATAFNGAASFAQNILNLRSNGCDIIVDDVFYFNESPFQDGIIAQAVNTVTANGALYFSSAGNEGNLKDQTSGTWEGDFVDGGPAGSPVNIGGGSVHSFGAATFNTVIYPGLQVVDLFWADPLGASANDYDLFVLDPTGSYVVMSSLDLQDGTQDPYEQVYGVNPGDRIVIVKAAGDARFLHLSMARGTLSVSTAGATKGHSAAAAAFSVAAVDAATSYPNPFTGGLQNPVETFSADGPRRIFFDADGTPITPGNFSSTGGMVRQKPDIAAADGVQTLVFGRFFGTSAAAPHAAAIAALLRSYDPTLTPGQIRAALVDTALDIEAPGLDSNSGAGIVVADLALQALPPRPVVMGGDAALLTESCPNGALDPGETVTMNFALVNVGVANTTNLVATLLSSGGITAPSGPRTYGVLAAKGGPSSQPFSFVATGTCGGTNIATLQLQDGPNDLGTVRFAFRPGNPRVTLVENFDSATRPALPPGWTRFQSGAGAGWVTTSSASDTPPNSVFVPDPETSSDKRLTSPIFPVVTAAAQLTFQHSYNTEECCDRGFLEISIAGGAFTDIISAGGSFVTGAYNGSGWGGFSGGFITTTVNLPASAAGKDVRLQWHFISDSSVSGPGWYIDSISLTDGFDCCASVANNLVVRITDAPDPVVVGGKLTYTISLYNTGPAPAAGVILTDVLPDNFTMQSLTVSQGVSPGPQVNGGGTLSFNLGTLPAGGSATFVIGGTADSLGLMTNRVTVSRTDPDANTNDNTAMAVTLVNQPALSVSDASLFEGNAGTSNAVFTASLWPPPGQTVTVHFATTSLSAVAGSDYVNTSGTLVFAPGVTNRTFAVPVFGDRSNEEDETFAVNLSSPTNALLARSQGLGTILNDDSLPNVSVSDATVVVPNPGTTNAVFNVRLSTPSGRVVTVSGYTSDGTAYSGSDYASFSEQLTFNPGETNKTVSVTVNAHISVKPAQTFNFNLSGVANAKLGHNPGVGTIITALPGQMDHFSWSGVSSPQSNGVPFAVTLTAQDFWNRTVSNFNGTANLRGLSGAVGAGGLVVGISAAGNSAEINALRDTLTALGHEVRPVSQGNWAGLDVVLSNPGGEPSSFGPSALEIAAGVNCIQIGDWGSDWTPNSWASTSQGANITLSLGNAHPITTGLEASWTSRGFWRYGASSENYVGWSTDESLPSLAREVSLVNQSRVLVANTLGAGRAVYVGWNVYGPDASPNDLALLGNAIQWAAVGATGTTQPLPITPPYSGNFSNGVWSGHVTVQQPATNVTLRADDGLGHVGQSNPFDVDPLRGQTTHFVWSQIASPQSNGAPFAVTITAQDYFNDTASNFTGTVAFDGSGVVGTRTNTILSAPTHTDSSSGTYTFGYSFTPRTNMTVTHVRHYFGNLVRIWTDAGVLLASRTVASTPGIWRETAITPVSLVAGQRYRIGVYTGGGNYYWRYDLPGTFADGTIDQGYEASGNAFPTNTSSPRWWFVDLRYQAETVGPVAVSPANSGGFSGGIWSGNLAVFQAATNVTLRADDGIGHVGQSLPFNVAPVPGQVTRFVWSAIPSPQSNGVPFAVTITAQDFLNGTASNFTGTVALTGRGVVGTRTNTMLGAATHSDFYSSANTVGHSFTPRTNLTVTHVRHYFGTRVSIWTDAGVLLAAQNVTSTAGTWRETALATPVELLAGQRYRIGVYAGSGNIFYRYDLAGTFADGTIDQAYYTSGSAFPNNTDSPRWYFIDLRYRVDTIGSVPVSPAISGNFTDGVWIGSVTMPQPGTNVTLRADDGLGHTGSSNPFNVAVQNDLSLVMLDAPLPVFLGGTVTYTLTVSNIGPTDATGVVVTNLLPPTVTLVSAMSSQGTCVPTGGAVICDLGTVPGGTNAMITIVVQPMAIGVITNVAAVSRSEPDVLLGNNTATAVTRVRSPFNARVAVYGAPVEDSWNTDVRNKLVTAGSSALAGSFSSVNSVLVRSGLPVPTLAQLQQYDAVLVYSDATFNDSVALGNVLADYVDNGGGVVLATFAFNSGGGNGISGRISTGGYLPFTLGSGSSAVNLTLVADEPAHPILGGLSSFNGGSSSFHNSPISPAPGAELVAHWSNQQPLVGVKQLAPGRVVGLNFYPPSSDARSDFWQSSTDGGLLMANALLWAAQRPNDIAIGMTSAPDPVAAGLSLAYTLTVTNSGPSAATAVTVSNRLPAGVSFVSANASQGTCTQSGGLVTCDLGTVSGASNATITILVVPTTAGVTITNLATVGRGEIDYYAGNNTATVTTVITAPAVSIADAAVVEGNRGTTNLVFAVTLTAPSAQAITVNYASTDGTARAGSDYGGTNGMLTFPAGTTNAMITVVVPGDVLIEGNETLFVDLSGPNGAGVARSQGVGTILNDDGLPGDLHHFTWSSIASPQWSGAPFAVTLTAQDYFNSTASNFNGAVMLSGIGTTNSILGGPAHSGSAVKSATTVGYAFTPNADLTVTHVRHYFGTKVSIWTDAGVLLATQQVASVLGTWVETPLAAPLVLAAGVRYRVGVHVPSLAGCFYRTDGTNTFSHGTIDGSYQGSGDSSPNNPDANRWWFVDLRYTVGPSAPYLIAPSNSVSLANGVWSGNITAFQAASNVVLHADDGQGHFGNSNPFDVAATIAQLQIEHSGNLVILSWPAALSDFILESTPITGLATDWQPLTNSPVIVGNRNTVTNVVSGSNMFYRLKRQ